MTTLSIRTFLGAAISSTLLGFALITAMPSHIVHAQDYVSPLVSNIYLKNVSDTSITVTWQTNEPTTSLIWYSLAAANGQTITQPSLADARARALTGYSTSHRADLTGLEAGKKYAFIVGGLDYASNFGASYEQTFTTTSHSTVDAPVITSLSTEKIGQYKTTISSKTSQPAYVTFVFNIVGQSNSRTYESSEYRKEQDIMLSDLTADTQYEGRLTAKNSNGVTTTSNLISWRTLGQNVPPVTSLKIYNTSVMTYHKYSSASISWKTNNSSNSVIEYSTSADFASPLIVSRSGMTKNHSLNLRNLSSRIFYYVRVKSTDSSNNTATDDVIIYVTR